MLVNTFEYFILLFCVYVWDQGRRGGSFFLLGGGGAMVSDIYTHSYSIYKFNNIFANIKYMLSPQKLPYGVFQLPLICYSFDE